MKIIKTLVFTMRTLFKIDSFDMGLVIFFTILSGITPVVTIQMTSYIFNILQTEEKNADELIFLVGGYIVIMLLVTSISNICGYFNGKLGVKIGYAMTEQLMTISGQLTLEQLEDSEIYEKITRIEDEIKTKPIEVFESILQIVASIIILCSAVSMLLIWKGSIAVFLLIYNLVQIYFYLKIAHQEFRMMYERSEKERKIWYYTFLLTHDTGFKEIKILNLKDYFLEKYKRLTNNFIKDEVQLSKKRLNLNMLLMIIQEIFSGFIMFNAIKEAYQGNILIGTAFAIISALSMAYSTTRSISDNLYSLYNSSLYMEQWREFLKYGDKKEKIECEKISIPHIYEISFSNVSYYYKKDENGFKLHDINFKLKQGQRVAIVGKNGSGKSTILKLIVGLYKPRTGKIKINNCDSEFIDIELYQRNITVLFQDFLKYEATVLENIIISDVEKSKDIERVYKSIKEANFTLHNNKDNLLNIQLGNWFSNGQQLSGGEWQKIALARTYYKQADMIVLDEPSAALDSSAENKIFQTFFDITREKIGVYITHRVSIAKKADIIIVMDSGKIESIGTHDDLLLKSDIYRQLYEFEKGK